MTKFLKNADVTGYISQTSVTSSLVKTDSNGKLVAATAGTDYQAPTTALLPAGGTAGQILSKINATDYNTQWIDNFAAQLKHEVKLGATLSKGAAVYVSSANGTNMIVSAASNASEATSSKTLGLLETGGVTNDLVKVITEGLLAGLDTSTASAGDPVWLGVNGALIFGLANKPVAPAHMVFIGIVTRVQSVNGEIFVKVQNGFELDELHNVAISSVVNNQGLFYESATSLWKNKTIAAALGYTPANGADYLPLAGGTLTGALYGTSAKFNSYFGTDMGSGGIYFSGDGTPDIAYIGYNYTNINGTEAVYQSARSSWRQHFGNGSTNAWKLAYRAGNAAASSWTDYLTISSAGAATFSSTISLADYININGASNSYLNLNAVNAGGNEAGVYFKIGGTAKWEQYTAANDGNLSFWSNGNGIRFYITPAGGANFAGNLTASSFIKSGGTSAQFLKADGSVDSSTYLTSYTEADTLATVTARGASTTASITVNNSSNFYGFTTINGGGITTPQGAFYASAYPTTADRYYAQFSGNWASAGTWALGVRGSADNSIYLAKNNSGVLDLATAVNLYIGSGLALHTSNYSTYALPKTGGSLTGNLTFSTQGSKIIFGDSTSTSPIMIGEGLVDTEGTDSDFMTLYFRNSFRVFSQLVEIGRFTNTGLRVYGSIVKDGGTSTQFLKADGSVDSSTYALSSTLSNYLPLAGGTMSGVLYGNGGGDFFIYTYGRTGLPNAGKILYNNGTGSNMFFGEIGTDIYGFTNNLYSDIPALAMNVSSKKVTINGNAPTGMLTVQARADGNMFSIRGSIAGYSYPNIVEMGQSGADGYINVKDGAGNVQSVISGYGGTATYFLSKLGVGIASPNARLEVTSSTSGSAEVQRWSYNTGDANYSLRLRQDVTSGLVKHAFDVVNASTTYSNNLVLDRGNVGIGTASPIIALSVRKDTNDWIGQFKNYGIGAYGLTVDLSSSTGSTTGYALGVYTQTGTGFFIQNNGNVGIGTTSPGYGLDIQNLSSAGAYLNITKTGYASAFLQPYNDGVYFGSFNLYNLYFRTNNTTNMTILTNGNVGINTTSPSYLFDVNGGARITGQLTSDYRLGLPGMTIGYWDSVNNRIESGSRPLLITSYGQPINMGINGATNFSISNDGSTNVNGLFTAGAGININSGVVKMRWGGNTTPTLGHNIGGSDTGNSFHIEVSDSDTGGLCIQNDGVTVYGAGDAGFVFRVIDEDSFQGGGGAEANTCFKVNQGAGGGGYIKGDFTMTGSAYANAFYETSDSRLKSLIEDNYQAKGIESIKAKLYVKNGVEELGYYAQDVQSILPSAVTTDTEGYLSLSYREVHTAKIARLEKEVEELKSQLARL